MAIEQIRPWPIINSQIGGINIGSYPVDVSGIRDLPLPDIIRSWWGQDITPLVTSFFGSPRFRNYWKHLEGISRGGSPEHLSALMTPLEVRNGGFAPRTNLFIVPRQISWGDVKDGILSLQFGLGEVTGDAREPLCVPKDRDILGINYKDPRGQLAALLSQSSGAIPVQSTLGFKILFY